MSIDQKTQAELQESKFGQLSVSQVMETTVRSEEQDANTQLIASLLMEGFGSVPIVDGTNRLQGIVSEFDLLNAIHKGNALVDITAQEIMTTNPVSVTEDAKMFTVIEILQNNHLIRVPVIDAAGKLVGLIARRDILRAYLHANSQPKM